MIILDRPKFDAQINELLTAAEALIPEKEPGDLPFMMDAPDVRAWHRFELALWNKGEAIRQLILKSRKEPDTEQIRRICRICTDPFAKRGRQSFILLLGKKRFADHASLIAAQLPDDDVAGQVIITLYQMGCSGYLAQIEPFTKHDRAWIRNAAKKYVDKYSRI